MDIAAVRQGLATAAAALGGGLTATGYAPGVAVPPCFFPLGVEIDFDDAAARELDSVTVSCRLLVSHADDQAAQAALDAYLAGSGAGSIKTALESDPTLGGACDWVRVARIDNYGLHLVGDTAYLGVAVTVEVQG